MTAITEIACKMQNVFSVTMPMNRQTLLFPSIISYQKTFCWSLTRSVALRAFSKVRTWKDPRVGSKDAAAPLADGGGMEDPWAGGHGADMRVDRSPSLPR